MLAREELLDRPEFFHVLDGSHPDRELIAVAVGIETGFAHQSLRAAMQEMNHPRVLSADRAESLGFRHEAWIPASVETLRMVNPDDEEWCRERIAELEEENRELRRSALRFGELAERLNVQLREERRQGGDRRRVTRETPDRRVAEHK